MTDSTARRYKLSIYNVFLRMDRDRLLVFNAVTRALAIISAEELRTLHTIHLTGRGCESDELMDRFLDASYVTFRDIDEVDLVRAQHYGSRFSSDGLSMTIAPTLACNFACTYCFEASKKPKGAMKRPVRDAIVSFFEKRAPKLRRFGVAWYGGEPLLGLPAIRDLSVRFKEIAREHGVRYSASLTTNGYLLSGPVIEELAGHNVGSIQVTLDGPPAVHDERRPHANGGPTFWKIIGNLKEIRGKTKTSIHVRVNVDRRNAEGIPALIDILSGEGITRANGYHTYFAPVEALTLDCYDCASHCYSRADFADVEMRLYRYGVAKGVANPPYPWGVGVGNCAAVRPTSFVVTHTGDLFKCWDEVAYPEKSFGTILDADTGEKRRPNLNLRRWLTWSFGEECSSCRIFPLCVGGCPLKAVYSGEVAAVSKSPCWQYRYNLRERIRYFAVLKGVLNQEAAVRHETARAE